MKSAFITQFSMTERKNAVWGKKCAITTKEGSGNTGGSKWQFQVKVMQFAHRQKWDCHQSPAVFSIYDTEFEN